MEAMTKGERQRIIHLYNQGWTTRRIAESLGRSPAGIRRIRQQFRERGTLEPRKRGNGPPPKVTEQDRQRLAELVRQHPDATLDELLELSGLPVCRSTIDVHLRRLRISFKKKVLYAAEQDRPDVAQRRSQWRMNLPALDPHKLIFIDETWAKTNMTRRRGRAPIGQRLIEKVSHGHWKTTTLIAALDCRGIRCATTVDGAVNGELFAAFIEQVLRPTLEPGQIVVMDNLSSHKTARVRQLIHDARAHLWFLPPYSPDLNPIELAFSQLRRLYESAGHRTVSALWQQTQGLLDQVTAEHAAAYFRHCGYQNATKLMDED